MLAGRSRMAPCPTARRSAPVLMRAGEPLARQARRKTLVMGVLNITPDSFFDGGEITDAAAALARAREQIAHGASVLDIGGESSRPGADPVSQETELARVLPALEAVRELGVPVSVDTWRAETARKALGAGAAMINDITALQGDPAMAGVIADAGAECVLMHMRGTPKTMQREPRYDDVIDDIRAFFEERMARAMQEGVPEAAIWLDPGFGFGKTVTHNLQLLRRLNEFHQLGRPLLVGTSNKSTIGAVLNAPAHDRTEGTAATVAYAIAQGANAVRVHDVKTMARVAAMCDAIRGRSAHE